jgi:xylulokinase
MQRTATDEGSAYGAALLGGVAAGVFGDVHEAVATCVRLLDPVEPDPQWGAAYESGYRRFRMLYPALRPMQDA